VWIPLELLAMPVGVVPGARAVTRAGADCRSLHQTLSARTGQGFRPHARTVSGTARTWPRRQTSPTRTWTRATRTPTRRTSSHGTCANPTS